ncbi:nickel-dependent lactate racemase [bacterium]|nr:nickel-dependent lactate racemase [bacterium]
MNIEIPYGISTISVSLKDVVPEILYPKSFTIENEEKTLKDAIENPIDSRNFHEFIYGEEELLIIVNDATRPTPTAKILHLLFPFIKNKKLKFLIAAGTHRAPIENELITIFGVIYELIKDSIHIHDARKFDLMTFYGTTKRGTKIYLNNILDKAKKIITINSVEPHYYAGFTGGRKSILPGIASYETIEQNHKFALSEGAQSLKLIGNPVHEDMIEALDSLEGKEIFSIQTVLDLHHRIYTATAGNIHHSFNSCIVKALDVFSVPIKEKADIVVTAASHPLDIDFYQSHKAIDNGKHALKENGILILVSECRDGIGLRTFYEYLCDASKPDDVITNANHHYKLGCHIAANIARIVSKNEIWAVTNLDDSDLKKMFMKPYKSLQTALDDALKKKKNPKVIFLMQGSVTVPNIVGRGQHN